MIPYIIGGIFLGSITGGWIGLLITNIIEPSKLIRVFVITASVIACAFLCVLYLIKNHENFNNGYCIKCGTQYVAVNHRYAATYYECPNCYFGVWY